MTVEDRERGWWGVPAAENWTCPECGKSSPVEAWEEREPYCENCGSHDGRECPECGEVYEHVHASGTLAAVQPVACECGWSGTRGDLRPEPSLKGWREDTPLHCPACGKEVPR